MLRNIRNIPEDLNLQGYYLSNLYYTTIVGFYFSLVFHLLIDKLLLISYQLLMDKLLLMMLRVLNE
jgi:hypothetical protein